MGLLCSLLTQSGHCRSVQSLAIATSVRQTGVMNTPWKWIALGLGAALIILAIFTILVVNGVMDFGFSVL